jgi:hypothetical protein
MMFYDHMVLRVTSREQFTNQTVAECYKSSSSLEAAGKFNRLEIASYDTKKTTKINLDSEELDISSINLNRVMRLTFVHSYFPQAELGFHFAPKPQSLLWNPPKLIYRVHEDYVNNDNKGKHLQKLLLAFKEWIVSLNAYYGGAYFGSFNRIGEYPSGRPLGSQIPIGDLISSISWATYFGPELVEYIGREKILSAPVYKTEILVQGGILIVLVPGPTDTTIVEAQTKVIENLGLKLYDEKVRIQKMRDLFRANRLNQNEKLDFAN